MDLTIFEATPGKRVLFHPDSPRFTISGVSQDMCRFLNMQRAELIGRSVFEAFPPNPADPDFSGHRNLRASLDQVLQTCAPHQMQRQRYDIQREGIFEETFWSNHSVPVLDEAGAVRFIIHTAEDITAQVRSEQNLLRHEGIEKAYNLFMQVPFVVGVVSGPDHVLQLANAEALKLWGKGPEIVGKPLLETIPELAGQNVLELFDEVKRTGKPYFAKAVPIVSMADGQPTRFYFDLIYQPIFEGDAEEAVGVFTVSQDVTEQVLALQRVEASEQRFRALVTTTADVVYRMNADWTEMQELHGRGFLSDAGAPISNWQEKYILPEDRVRVEAAIQQAVDTRSTLQVEHRVHQKDGGVGWVFARAVPIVDESGAVIEWFGAASDITRRKQADEELLAMTEKAEKQKRLYEAVTANTPDLIYVFALDYTFSYANDALLAMWGKTWEEAIGKRLIENGYEPWHAEMHEREIDSIIATKKPVRGEVSFPHATLGRRIYDYILVPVINAEGQVEAVAGTTRDITEIRRAEEVLRQSSEKLEGLVQERTRELQRSNQELEDFAYAASHDLKEPIRKINFFAERLKHRLEGKLEEEDRRYFERLETGAERMSTLIEDLLLYSHVNRGITSLETVDLNETLSYVVDDLGLHIEQKGARVEVDPLPVVRGQQRQLQQVFENLIGNALKYCRLDVRPRVRVQSRLTKGADLPLRLTEEERGRDFQLIEVCDNGIGFPQEDAERIFNMFTRLHGNSEYKGTGVGLSIVQKVVQSHGGHIWAESCPGEGSAFRMVFPVSRH